MARTEAPACGDLHHGPNPIGTLEEYCAAEPHDAVLLTFNPALLQDVQQRLPCPCAAWLQRFSLPSSHT